MGLNNIPISDHAQHPMQVQYESQTICLLPDAQRLQFQTHTECTTRDASDGTREAICYGNMGTSCSRIVVVNRSSHIPLYILHSVDQGDKS